MKIDDLTRTVIGLAYRVHNCLGPNLLEKVYENSLMVELELAGIQAAQQHPLPVFYRERLVGDFKADIVVDQRLILELKAVREIAPEHEVQLVNYLNIAKIDDGLLLNFGKSVEVQRKFRVFRPEGIAESF